MKKTPKTKTPQFPYAHLLQLPDTETNPAQWRMDMWNRSREMISRLNRGSSINTSLLQELSALIGNGQFAAYEALWAFPGASVLDELNALLMKEDYDLLEKKLSNVVHLLSIYGDQAGRIYRKLSPNHENLDIVLESAKNQKKHFTLLIVDDMTREVRQELLEQLAPMQRSCDDFVYDIVFAGTIEEALLATLYNQNILACVIREDLPIRQPDLSGHAFKGFIEAWANAQEQKERGTGLAFGDLLRDLIPSMGLFLIGDTAIDIDQKEAGAFDRTFYRYEDILEIHITILDSVRKLYQTPFFDSLKSYAERPVGNFHALPVARGHSVFNSAWLSDMREFYGDNVFLAETSSTCGGLDSLLDPKGSVKQAQELAAKTFGSQHTFFATNGTSTSNKIVVQALVQPGDIVLIDRNCHKSHHYGMVMAGAKPLYLNADWKEKYGIYSGVSLITITDSLKQLKKEGLLDKVKMVLLTNCTFDGIVYNPEMVMEEILKIKPDIYFLWDEAWFAYARFFPTTRRRTAMHAARNLEKRYGDELQLHVYSTQSTHKSLSSFRQGSMIHVYDTTFEKTRDAFKEAFYTHTSTSPNYQILASLDLARRQMDLEGFKLVSANFQKANYLRRKIKEDPIISRMFTVLEESDLISEEFQVPRSTEKSASGTEAEATEHTTVDSIDLQWKDYEFVLDPTRITLCTTRAALGGNEFKVQELMDKYSIQVNKTSINNVLFIVTIGVTWGGVDYLLESLRKLAGEQTRKLEQASGPEKAFLEQKIKALEKGAGEKSAAPDFQKFHPDFSEDQAQKVGDMRSAFYRAYDPANKEYIPLTTLLQQDQEYVSAGFIIPYPPGFPILVPGQLITKQILNFMNELDIKEIHGYNARYGLPILRIQNSENIKETSMEKELQETSLTSG